MSTIDNNPALRAEGAHQPNDASLEKAFEAFWNELPEYLTGRQSDEEKRKALEREVVFVDKVYSAVTQLAETRDGPITILFDVDETLVKDEYGEDDQVTTYVRPGFGVLMQAIDSTLGDRVDIGLLTSRAQSHLDEEIASPSYTQAVSGKINPDFVISSRDGHLLTGHEALQDAPRSMTAGEELLSLNAIRRIIDPRLASDVEADDWSAIAKRVNRGYWYDTKLAILQHLAQEHPERGFVFVDDLPFPAAIDPEHSQVRGVTVDDAPFSVY